MKNRIAILRKERGLTLAALAQAAGTTKAQIQKLERGDRRLSLDWMERIARGLGVKMSDLLPAEQVARQRGRAEHEILEIIGHLPEKEQVMLVKMARELVETLKRVNTAPKRPRRKAAAPRTRRS